MPEEWPPEADTDRPRCDRCGNHVSHSFHRQWADNDDRLFGCRECLPRSARFGADPYDRDLDDISDFNLDGPNKGKEPGGIQRKNIDPKEE